MLNLPVIFLACKVFEGLIPPRNNVTYKYLDYGLHSIPNQLKDTLQKEINHIEEPSLIVFGYGLCGNGLDQIEAGKHTLIIPKADDCVTIFMGSRSRYLSQHNDNPGTYYLTKGWFEVGSDPLAEYENLVEKYDKETAEWLMDKLYTNYSRLLFVAQEQEDFITYRSRALEVAEYCEQFGMVYEEYLGSREFIDDLTETLTRQENWTSNFIVVPPGGVTSQEMFR